MIQDKICDCWQQRESAPYTTNMIVALRQMYFYIGCLSKHFMQPPLEGLKEAEN